MADSNWTNAAVLLLAILLGGWIQSQFGQLSGRAPEAFIATTYQAMAIVALIALVAGSFAFFRVIGFSPNTSTIVRNLAIGGIVGFIMTASGKLFLGKLLTGGAIDPTLGFSFIVLLAPIVEEFFFRGTLFPSFERYFGGRQSALVATVAAAIAASVLFAVWHLVASGGNESVLAGEFIFSLIQIGLIRATGSLDAALGSHFVRNLITGG